MLKIVHLVFDLLESTKGSECRLVDRRTRLEMNMLVQQSQLQTTSAHDVAAIGSLVTPDETKDRAFARSVSTYQADVFTRVHLQRCAAQDILNTVRFVNV